MAQSRGAAMARRNAEVMTAVAALSMPSDDATSSTAVIEVGVARSTITTTLARSSDGS